MIKSEELENNIRLKLLEYAERPDIQSQITEAFYIWQDNPDSIQQYSSEDDLDDEQFSRFYDWFIFDFKTLNKNLRVIEKFYLDSKNILEKNEAKVAKDWIESTNSFFEIKEIEKGEYCKIRNLFSGTEITVHDSAVSKSINLTNIIAGRPLKTLNRYYFFGLITVYPLIIRSLLLDYFTKQFELYKIRYSADKTYTDYLKDFGYLIAKHIENAISHPHFLTAEGEEFVVTKSVYTLKNRDKIIKTIKNNHNFKLLNNTNEELTIFNLDSIEGMSIDAYLEIEDKTLTINSYTVKKLKTAKDFIQKLLQGFIKHKKDNTVDFKKHSDNKENSTFKLPRGYRSRKKFDNELDDYYKGWIDKPMDQLGGLSPRKALSTAKGRTKLERVLTDLEMLYDDAKKAGEPYYDVGKLRKKLQKTMN